jgi:hypothetical protein
MNYGSSIAWSVAACFEGRLAFTGCRLLLRAFLGADMNILAMFMSALSL